MLQEAVINALLSRLTDGDNAVRFRAALALEQLGSIPDSTVIPNDITIALNKWIDQNQECVYVAGGVRVLWNIMNGEAR
jgi:HEAT repeat protein